MKREDMEKRYKKLKDTDKILFNIALLNKGVMQTETVILLMGLWVVYMISLFFIWFLPKISILILGILLLLILFVVLLSFNKNKKFQDKLEEFLLRKTKWK